ncbi:ABC transporter substrate-binding protein [Gabonibacter chumensis]|uniref:ABC transporter substrate-binding protein n=1 Tax=Gabonibacter chumensis TaxID=2972474 RepID=UPI00257286E6|nr:ABC transporter substrate-binding protein [Gabonibacter chumensis]MCR9011429.1 ABC transporter substrate-binding protein [Gabonibacter chumensis]
MNTFMRLSLVLLLSVGLLSCKPEKRRAKVDSVVSGIKAEADTAGQIRLKYAQGFRVEYRKDYLLLEIQDPQNKNSTCYRFVLKKRGSHASFPEGVPVIDLPVRHLICMTSLQLSNVIKLGAMDRVVGITSTRYLFNETMQKQVDEGRTQKIGIEGNFDNEVIMNINPDLMLISPFKRGGYDAVKDIGIPLVPHLGYKEMTPLGQAEWIKFTGLLLGMEEDANRIFGQIEQRYNELKRLVRDVKRRPVVFSGELRGGVWYAVGGKSFLAQLFHDAGADYFLKDDPRSGGVTLDFETVYNQAESADYWRIANSFPGEYSYDALKAQDERYADFKAFRQKGVIYCNMREKPFYESMPAEPDIVLADMIRVFHPELLPDYRPVYYDLLKK